MNTLYLPPDLRERIASWAREGYPFEACGLLLGRGRGSETEVRRVFPARNLNRERREDRYELDPEDFLKADRAAREAGLEVVGVWHSHPDHPARPSETDRAGAWEGWSYLILCVSAKGVEDFRSWRLEGGSFTEEVLKP